MIVCAGLTPAWQQIYLFERLRSGEVNRAAEVQACGSGKVLNVAMALGHLGAEVTTVCPLGGPPRIAIEGEFAALGFSARWVETQAATRVCTTFIDRATDVTTELVENAQPLIEAELSEFRRTFADAARTATALVLTGSLPAGTPREFYRDLIGDCQAPVVIDARGAELLAALEKRPLFVKPNREELGHTLDRTLDTDDQLLLAMRELNRRGAQWVVVSSGKRSVWMTSRERTFRFEPALVDRVVNPIGCGDCLAAGIAAGISAGQAPEQCVRLGMAAAAENLRELLPARVDRERVAAIASKIRFEATESSP